jgi:Holin of 3TMs, for gene-transfer release
MAGIMDIITGLVGGVGDAVSKVTNAVGVLPADKQAELTATLAKLQADAANAQAAITASQAASAQKFVAWPRPAVMWVCVLAFALNYLIEPLVTWVLRIANNPLVLPTLDLTTMMPILLGTLGLGAYRTIEKVQGVQGNH